MLVVILLLTFGVSFQMNAGRVDGALRKHDLDIAIKQFTIIDMDREISRFRAISLQLGGLSGEKKVVDSPSERLNCLMCHDLEQVRGFHYPERIMQIEEAKGQRRRICINCHGPPEDSISIPDPSKPYPSDDSHPHRVHQTKLDTNEITCETCHEYQGKYRFPKPQEGQLLVCELCHADGNFITIHIDGKILEDAQVDPIWIKEGGKHKCQECHWGDVVDIHQRATTNLGNY